MKRKNNNNNAPLVSVVIATYNPLRTIEKCLQSIVDQTYKNIEIIVVDAKNFPSKEKKKYEKIIKKYSRYLQDGPERSIQRNRGIKEARGEYVLVIDQDMYLSKNVVQECVEVSLRSSPVALIIPEISIGEGYWTRCVALERYVSVYLERGLNECCRFFRKSDALKIGGYDPALIGAEDSDLHYRFSKIGKIKKIQSIIYHDEGRTRFFDRVKKKYYYSKTFLAYIAKYPDIATKQFSPFKSAYLKHWKILLSHPLVTLGMFTLRASEVMAGMIGMLANRK